jgi:hypothetical protein
VPNGRCLKYFLVGLFKGRFLGANDDPFCLCDGSWMLGFYHYAIWPKRHNVWSATKHPSYYICSISDSLFMSSWKHPWFVPRNNHSHHEARSVEAGLDTWLHIVCIPPRTNCMRSGACASNLVILGALYATFSTRLAVVRTIPSDTSDTSSKDEL